KSHDGVPAGRLDALVEAELLRLSVVAFAMFNRGRQWIEERELDRDLAALLGSAETVLGRFFFMQRAQATRDGAQLASYEFLHATFGEYLVARLVHRVVRDLAAQERAAAHAVLGAGGGQDGLLYALLSFAPLTV